VVKGSGKLDFLFEGSGLSLPQEVETNGDLTLTDLDSECRFAKENKQMLNTKKDAVKVNGDQILNFPKPGSGNFSDSHEKTHIQASEAASPPSTKPFHEPQHGKKRIDTNSLT
jgi:hypothetical protein